MTFLIDGYNLLHAVGLTHKSMSRGQFDRARRKLLDWLAERHGGESVRVVFDAQNAPGPRRDDEDYRGIAVRFAVGQLADDLIEELVAAEPNPKRLTVVSNDRRVREAATRRGCTAWACSAFVDHLIDTGVKRPKPSPDDSGKPEAVDESELTEWMKRFNSGP